MIATSPSPGADEWNKLAHKHACYADPAWLSLTNERTFVDQQQQIKER